MSKVDGGENGLEQNIESAETMFGLIFLVLKVMLWRLLLLQFQITTFLRLRSRTGYAKTVDTYRIGTLVRWFSTEELSKLFPDRETTRPLYLKSCKAHGYTPRIEELANGASALYYGADPTVADKVLVYLHGGGFYFGMVPGHWDFFDSLIRESHKHGKVLSVAVLEYTLTPKKRCPYQITQTITFFSHLLASIPPSKILLSGESAGGNLGLALLAHILHPSAYGPPITLEAPLAGCLLISPWVTFSMGAASMAKFVDHDVLTPDFIRVCVEYYNPKLNVRNGWTEPLVAEKGWWRGCGDLVNGKILVTGGSQELMRDDLVALEKMFVGEGVPVEVFLPDGLHAEPMHGHTDPGPEGSAAWLAQLRWLGEVVSE